MDRTWICSRILCDSGATLPVTPRSALSAAGMQAHIIEPTDLSALPEGQILPQYLRELGYVTRAVGKWHLGHHSKNCTPTRRGFDSHFGYWNGFVGYYDFIVQSGNMSGCDLRDDMKTSWQHSGRYVTDVFTEQAERIIREHDTARPLFLYFSHLACHAGDPAKLLDAPQEAVNRFGYISDPNRRLLAAVVSKMDESVGRVVLALERRGILNNSVIVVASDNGAPTSGYLPNWGSNYPLRGIKGTLWEGGVRGVAAVWSPLLQNTPRVSHQLMHLTDWLPTLYAAAGGDATSLPGDLDGLDLWPQLVSGGPSPREEILLNVDEEAGSAAVRVGHWKLVTGPQRSGEYEGASGLEDVGRTPRFDPRQVLSSAAAAALRSTVGASTPAEDILRLRTQATVSCPDRPLEPRCLVLDSSDLCVFDLEEDPCEAGAGLAPEGVLSSLLERLEALSRPLLPQQVANTQPKMADPRRWNNTWAPWTDCLLEPSDQACNVL